MKVSKQQQIRNVLEAASDERFEVQVLLDVVDFLRDSDQQDPDLKGDTQVQIMVLEGIIRERLHSLYHSVEFLQQATAPKPKAKSRKPKLAKAA